MVLTENDATVQEQADHEDVDRGVFYQFLFCFYRILCQLAALPCRKAASPDRCHHYLQHGILRNTQNNFLGWIDGAVALSSF